jgi:hypothetical protein
MSVPGSPRSRLVSVYLVPVCPPPLLEVLLDRGGQPCGVQHRWSQLEGHVPQPVDARPERPVELCQRLGVRVVAEVSADQLDAQVRGGDDLDGVVVDVARDSPALVLLLREEALEEKPPGPVGARQLLQALVEVACPFPHLLVERGRERAERVVRLLVSA